MNPVPHHLLRASLLVAAVTLAGCTSMPWSSSSATPSSMSAATFSVKLSGAAEVPPVTTPASGTVDATFDRSTSVLRWKLSYTGLSGPATAAHFHGPAMPGANAGVAVPFQSAMSPSEGQATLTPAQVADLMAGRWYANVHTAANPGGEIRGQLVAR